MSQPTFSPSTTPFTQLNLPGLSAGSTVCVVGAGAFGGWTALFLLRHGLKVKLLDGWGAGNAMGSSGDESRIIRATYGANQFYFDLCLRALELWKEHEYRWSRKLFINSGLLWLCPEEHVAMLDDSVSLFQERGLHYQTWSPQELEKKYPFVKSSGLHHTVFDASAGFLLARDCTEAVVRSFVEEGGTFIKAFANPGAITSGVMDSISLSDGSVLTADAYIFATGAWLGKQFPQALGTRITSSRQEVFYFDIPRSGGYASFPAWIDADGTNFYYGIPGSSSGFKIGVDRRGEIFDPQQELRMGAPALLNEIRGYLSIRFPGLQHAKLNVSRVCPYENSSDGNFVLESHPAAANVVFLGGGSGHGFKHGPAWGEFVARSLVS